jgi:lipopolysaccharide export system permease protein
MRVRLLDRYLVGPFLRIFALTVLSAPVLFVLADVTVRLDVYLDGGMTIAEILRIYPSHIPVYMIWAFPVAALVATLFTLQPFVRHGELHATLGAGVPLYRLFLPLIIGGAAASLVGLLLVEAAPRLSGWSSGSHAGRVNIVGAQRGAFAYLTDAGEILTVENLTVGAEGSMTGLVLRSASDEPGVGVVYVVAQEGTWTDSEGWVARDGTRWSMAPDGAYGVVSFDEFALTSMTERPADLLEAHAADPSRMSFGDLGRFADRLERSGSPASYLRIRQWQRITIPLTTLVIILFSAPLATITGRGEGQSGAALALVLTIVYLAVLRTSEGLGVAGLLGPGLATSLPALVFGLAGLLLLRRARS